MSHPTYVTHAGHRWRVMQEITDPNDGPMYELSRRMGRVGENTGNAILRWALVSDCQPWKKTGLRRIISATTERGRKIIFEYDAKNDVVSLRLSRQRKALTTTLGGLYWTLQRQAAMNAKRDRAHARRVRRRI